MKNIPKQIKKEVGIHARDFRTASAIKKFTMICAKYSFVKITVNSWKKKKKKDGENTVIKKVGRPNSLDSSMLRKVSDIALGT